MKALKTFLLGGAMSIAVAGAAQAADFMPEQYATAAESGWYLRADLGWSFLDWSGGSDDDAFTGGGGIGYRYNEMFRTDLRIDWSGDYDVAPGVDLDFGTVLLNGYFDFPIGSQITPYVGVGAGYGWADLSPGSSDDGFAYALMAGVSFDMTQSLALDVGYRYRGVTVSGPDVQDHSLLAGLRFSF